MTQIIKQNEISIKVGIVQLTFGWDEMSGNCVIAWWHFNARHPHGTHSLFGRNNAYGWYIPCADGSEFIVRWSDILQEISIRPVLKDKPGRQWAKNIQSQIILCCISYRSLVEHLAYFTGYARNEKQNWINWNQNVVNKWKLARAGEVLSHEYTHKWWNFNVKSAPPHDRIGVKVCAHRWAKQKTVYKL